MEYLGIDLGSYAVKVVTKDNKMIFLSTITKEVDYYNNGIMVTIDNNKFLIGDENGNRDLNPMKSDRIENLLPLIYTAIALNSNQTDNCIAIGLPLAQWNAENKNKIISYMDRNSYKTVCLVNNGKSVSKTIMIKDVLVLPEGLSALPNNFKGVVIDIGGMTVDMAYYSKKDNKVTKFSSDPLGMESLQIDIINKINANYGAMYTQNEFKDIVVDGIKKNNAKFIPPEIDELSIAFTNRILSKINAQFPNISQYDVFLTGGGSFFLKKYLANKLNIVNNLDSIDNCIYDNAKGYYYRVLKKFNR